MDTISTRGQKVANKVLEFGFMLTQSRKMFL